LYVSCIFSHSTLPGALYFVSLFQQCCETWGGQAITTQHRFFAVCFLSHVHVCIFVLLFLHRYEPTLWVIILIIINYTFIPKWYNCYIVFLFVFIRLIFIPPYQQPLTISSLLWSIAVDDYILKLITIIFKIIVIMMPIKLLPIIKRVRWLLYYYLLNLFYVFIFV